MPVAAPLSTTQQITLTAAANRKDGFLLPLPAEVTLRGAARRGLLAALLRAGHAEETPASDPAAAWRTDETGRGLALRVTEQGLAAVGRVPRRTARARSTAPHSNGDHAVGPEREASRTKAAPSISGAGPSSIAQQSPPAPTDQQPPGGKLGAVLAALSADAGATLAELVTLTGWQPHTTRAALTRLRQRGYPLLRTEEHGRRAYRVSTAR